jgi:hypothetical protein
MYKVALSLSNRVGEDEWKQRWETSKWILVRHPSRK